MNHANHPLAAACITHSRIKPALLGSLIFGLSLSVAQAVDFTRYPALVALVDTMVGEDQYPRADLEAVLAGAVISQSVLRSISHPSEALPWPRYRDLFINQQRVSQGVMFWDAHEALLLRAQAAFGVPPAVVVALLGIETHYGTRLGDIRTLDALLTLTAEYPRRSGFFGKELRAFLNTARAEGIAPDSVFGSYAGAMGIPQFMPSSFAAYAVDFNANGRRDLVAEIADAVGSVGNYLQVHGWSAGQDIIIELHGELPPAAAALVKKRAKPTLSVAQLSAAGVDFDASGIEGKVALLQLQELEGARPFIGLKNFAAIARYNPSINYAMAVTELSQAISAQRAR